MQVFKNTSQSLSSTMDKLHLGCGQVYFDGWLNVDLDSPKADLRWDLSTQLPFGDNTVSFIFNEHFLEHLDLESGQNFLSECHRILRPGGFLRIAMPDLEFLLEKYHSDWKEQEWLSWPEYHFIESRVQMLNIAMRSWGHQYLYDKEELTLRMTQCGFSDITFQTNGRSIHPEFIGRETRSDSRLIAEATITS